MNKKKFRTRNPANLEFIKGLARKGCSHKSKKDYERKNKINLKDIENG
jgi:hypothetical protein